MSSLAPSIDVCRELRLLLVGVCVAVVGDIVCWDSVSDAPSGEQSAFDELVVVVVVVVVTVCWLFVCNDDVSDDGDAVDATAGN